MPKKFLKRAPGRIEILTGEGVKTYWRPR